MKNTNCCSARNPLENIKILGTPETTVGVTGISWEMFHENMKHVVLGLKPVNERLSEFLNVRHNSLQSACPTENSCEDMKNIFYTLHGV